MEITGIPQITAPEASPAADSASGFEAMLLGLAPPAPPGTAAPPPPTMRVEEVANGEPNAPTQKLDFHPNLGRGMNAFFAGSDPSSLPEGTSPRSPAEEAGRARAQEAFERNWTRRLERLPDAIAEQLAALSPMLAALYRPTDAPVEGTPLPDRLPIGRAAPSGLPGVLRGLVATDNAAEPAPADDLSDALAPEQPALPSTSARKLEGKSNARSADPSLATPGKAKIEFAAQMNETLPEPRPIGQPTAKNRAPFHGTSAAAARNAEAAGVASPAQVGQGLGVKATDSAKLLVENATPDGTTAVVAKVTHGDAGRSGFEPGHADTQEGFDEVDFRLTDEVSDPRAEGLTANSAKIEAKPVETSRVLSRREANLVVRQIADRIELLAAARPKDGVTIHLQPENLGTVTLIVKSTGSQIEAQMFASEEGVRDALQKSQPQLGVSLQNRGFELTRVTIESQSAAPSNGEAHAQARQGQPQSGQAPAPQLRLTDEVGAMKTPLPDWRRSAGGSGVDLWI